MLATMTPTSCPLLRLLSWPVTVGPGMVVEVGVYGVVVLEGLVVVEMVDEFVEVEREVVVTERDVVVAEEGKEEVVGGVIAEVVGIAVVRRDVVEGVAVVAVVVAGAPGRATEGGNVVPPNTYNDPSGIYSTFNPLFVAKT